MKYVLFVCTHNAGRSQMAQAFFERHAPDDVRAESAGSAPAAEVWPAVIEAMNEVGIDLRGHRPRKLMVEMQLHADWAVTMDAATSAPTSRPRSRTGICAIRRARASRRSARYAMRSRSAFVSSSSSGCRRSDRIGPRIRCGLCACCRRWSGSSVTGIPTPRSGPARTRSSPSTPMPRSGASR